MLLLNKEQEEAVLDNDHNLRIIAGAGTGKTRVITQKIIYLHQTLNYQLDRILAITFTNKAANEMLNRIYETIPFKRQNTYISTFHSFCLKILQQDIEKITQKNDKFTIIDEEDKKRYVKSFFKENNIKYNNGLIKHVLGKISVWKNINFDCLNYETYIDKLETEPRDLNLKIEKDIFAYYQKSLRKNNQFDYDDILIYAYHLLKIKEVKDKWQQKFDYIFVDEFQDVDLVQYNVLKSLYHKKNKIIVVGDPDQNIYSWRMASVNYILNFHVDFPNVKSIILDTNYRSTPEILNLANELIGKNIQRVEKNLVAIKKSKNSLPIIFENELKESESKEIIKKIKELKEKNLISNFKDVMILYRNNSIVMQLEEELIKEKIPYRIEKGIRFFERKEIKQIANLLRALIVNDDFSFTNFLISLKGIGEGTIKKLNAFSIREEKSIMEIIFSNNLELLIPKLPKELFEYKKIFQWALDELDVFEDPIIFLEDLIARFKIIEWYREKYEDNRVENVNSLKDILLNFWNNNSELKSSEILYQFLQELSLIQEESDLINDNNNQVDSVILSTIHKAKGLESKVVFIIGLEDGILPSYSGLNEGLEELEEERRILFVGITRAKDLLYLTFNKDYSFILSDNLKESSFLKELSTGNYQRKVIPYNKSYETNFDLKEIDSLTTKNLIKHLIFGIGEIQKLDQSKMEVNFDGKIKIIFFKSPLWKKVKN